MILRIYLLTRKYSVNILMIQSATNLNLQMIKKTTNSRIISELIPLAFALIFTFMNLLIILIVIQTLFLYLQLKKTNKLQISNNTKNIKIQITF